MSKPTITDHILAYQDAETASIELGLQIKLLQAKLKTAKGIMQTELDEIDAIQDGKNHIHQNKDGSQLYIKYKKCTTVTVFDVDALPDGLVTIVPESKKPVHKKEIRKYINENGEIVGAEITEYRELVLELIEE